MTTNSLLYYGFGLTEHEHLKTEYHQGCIYFHIITKEKFLQCSNCHSQDIDKQGVNKRQFCTIPIGLKPVYLIAYLQHLHCRNCGVTRQERIKFAEQNKAIPVNSNDTLLNS